MVASVEVVDGTVAGVILNDGERIAADAVICAVPVWNVKGLLDQVPGHERIYEAVEHLTPVPIVSVNLYLDRSIGMTDWGEIFYGGEGVLEQVWDRQQMHGRDAVAKPLLFDDGLGGVRADAEVEYRDHRDPDGHAAAVLPGRRGCGGDPQPCGPDAEIDVRATARYVRRCAPTSGLRLLRLALAGDWTRTDWTTTMEGACQSAARAVDVILDYAKHPA